MFRNLILSVILAIIFTWFALTNAQTVTVTILVQSFTVSLALVILVCILLGVILTGIISAAEQTKMLAKIRDLEGKLKHDEELIASKDKSKA